MNLLIDSPNKSNTSINNLKKKPLILTKLEVSPNIQNSKKITMRICKYIELPCQSHATLFDRQTEVEKCHKNIMLSLTILLASPTSLGIGSY